MFKFNRQCHKAGLVPTVVGDLKTGFCVRSVLWAGWSPLREKFGGLLVLALGCADWFIYRFEVILVQGWVCWGGFQLGLSTEDSN